MTDADDVVILVQIAGVEPAYGLAEFRARLGFLVLVRVADVRLRVRAHAEVDAVDRLVVVLREAAAGVDRQRFSTRPNTGRPAGRLNAPAP